MSATQITPTTFNYRGMGITRDSNGMFVFTDGLTNTPYWARDLDQLTKMIDGVLLTAAAPAPKPSLLTRILDWIGF